MIRSPFLFLMGDSTTPTTVLTIADEAELWCLWTTTLMEYDRHAARCGICLDEGSGLCPYVRDGLGVYVDYHLSLLRFRRAQTLREMERGIDHTAT